ALLRVRPNRRSLNLLDQGVGVVVAAENVRSAAAVACIDFGSVRRHRSLNRNAVHIIALVRLQKVHLPDIAARQIVAESINVPIRISSLEGIVPLTATHSAVAGKE